MNPSPTPTMLCAGLNWSPVALLLLRCQQLLVAGMGLELLVYLSRVVAANCCSTSAPHAINISAVSPLLPWMEMLFFPPVVSVVFYAQKILCD
ncbi:hypothetical protein DAI22_11g112100 [Oryza sativa Japonica Group]|nr:hypothetical protein DAI22_11g112100 [Oryza sativa Japonica Group]